MLHVLSTPGGRIDPSQQCGYPLKTDIHEAKHFSKFAHKNAGVTRNIVIDKKGNIAFLTRLFEQNEFNEMKTIIEELLIN